MARSGKFEPLGPSKTRHVCFTVLSHLISLGVFFCVAMYIFHVLMSFDINKRAYNHLPGPCKKLEGIEYGAEDVALIEDDGLAFISSGLFHMLDRAPEVDGNIFLYDFNHPNVKPLKLPIVGMENRAKFRPHGMTFWVTEGRIRLYVISHTPPEFHHFVEVFDYDREKIQLNHVKTIKDEKFVRPNNIVAVAEDKFILSNDGAAQTLFTNLLELLTFYRGGSLVLFDGEKTHYLEKSINANGVVTDRENRHLIVSHVNDRTIGVYEMAEDFTEITPISRIPVGTLPDNLWTDKHNTVYLAAHPVVNQAAQHLQECDNLQIHSPSQVLKLNFSDDWKSMELTEVLVNEGKLISASAVAVQYKGKLLVGSVCRQAVVCENPQ